MGMLKEIFSEPVVVDGVAYDMLLDRRRSGEHAPIDIAKAFNPNQPRDERGRWIDDPNAYAWALEKFGDEETAYNFQKWFNNSAVVDENGNPKVYYHGTTKDFSEFSGGMNNSHAQAVGTPMHFFTDNPEMAGSYAMLGDGANIKPVYLSIKRPLVIDADGKEWSETVGDVVENLSTYRTDKERAFQELRQTLAEKYAYEYEYDPDFVAPEQAEFERLHKELERDIVSGAYKDLAPLGVSHYDGVIIKNSYDWTAGPINKEADSFSPFGDVVIAFDSSQIKSATGNAGTFDTSGDISKAFNPNQPRDERGRWIDDPLAYSWALEKFGDEEKAYNFQKWFSGSKIVDENGNPAVVYHGTNKEFDSFDPSMIGTNTGNEGHQGHGLYFSSDRIEAETYGDRIVEVFVSMRNPFVLTPDSADLLRANGVDWIEEKRDFSLDYDSLHAAMLEHDPVAADLLSSLKNHGEDEAWDKFFELHPNWRDHQGFDLNDTRTLFDYSNKTVSDEYNDPMPEYVHDLLVQLGLVTR